MQPETYCFWLHLFHYSFTTGASVAAFAFGLRPRVDVVFLGALFSCTAGADDSVASDADLAGDLVLDFVVLFFFSESAFLVTVAAVFAAASFRGAVV